MCIIYDNKHIECLGYTQINKNFNDINLDSSNITKVVSNGTEVAYISDNKG